MSAKSAAAYWLPRLFALACFVSASWVLDGYGIPTVVNLGVVLLVIVGAAAFVLAPSEMV